MATEKAATIWAGAKAIGIIVHLGIMPLIVDNKKVTSLLTKKSEEFFGSKFIVEIDPERASQLPLGHIRDARRKFGLVS